MGFMLGFLVLVVNIWRKMMKLRNQWILLLMIYLVLLRLNHVFYLIPYHYILFKLYTNIYQNYIYIKIYYKIYKLQANYNIYIKY